MSPDVINGLNDNVFTLIPKVDKPESPEEVKHVPAKEVFKLATEAGFKDIIIIGYTEDDKCGFVTNLKNLAELNLMIDYTKKTLME